MALAGFAVLLASCGSQKSSTPQRVEATVAGQRVSFPPAKHFKLEDHRGQSVDLRDYKGRIVVLNFWATWCGPCRYEIPHLVEIRNSYDPKDVAIIGVSLDQGEVEQLRPVLKRFIEQYKINYPVVLDSKFELIRQYYREDLATLGVPTTFVIDRQGRVFRTHVGLPRDASGRPDPGRVLGEDIELLLKRS